MRVVVWGRMPSDLLCKNLGVLLSQVKYPPLLEYHEHQVDCDLIKDVFTKAVKVPPLDSAVLPRESMASSRDKVAIEPLDVDNCNTWCVRLKLFLIQKKIQTL
jgi:hypothetical protein